MLHRRFAAWLVTWDWTLIGVLCLSIPFTAAYPWLFASTQIVEGYQVDSTLLLGAPQIVMPLAMLPLLAVQLYGRCCQSNRNQSPVDIATATRMSDQIMIDCHSARAAERLAL